MQALGHKFVVVDFVQAELEMRKQNGRRDADLLDALVADQLCELVQLDGDAMAHFESLVIGPAISTLDGGEAATIACSILKEATAAIDERKASAICSERYPLLSVCSTVDILARPDVMNALGKDDLSAAVFRALTYGRMRVLPHNVRWVVDLIGPEQASICTSLPRDARRIRSSWLQKRVERRDEIAAGKRQA